MPFSRADDWRSLTPARASVPLRLVKLITPFLLLVAVVLTACETPQNQRSLYAPKKSSGPYTESLKSGSWRRGEYPAPKVEKKKAVDEVTPPADAIPPVAS